MQRPVASQASPPPAPEPLWLGQGRRFLRFPTVTRRTGPGSLSVAAPSPAGAAARSAIAPGWGQWASGQRRRGAILASITLLCLLVPPALLLAALYPLLPLLPLPVAPRTMLIQTGIALASLGRPAAGLFSGVDVDWVTLGWLALALNLGVLLFRGWAALDAARTARRRQERRPYRPLDVVGHGARRATVGGLLAALLVVAPHLGIGGAALAARPLLSQILQPQFGFQAGLIRGDAAGPDGQTDESKEPPVSTGAEIAEVLAALPATDGARPLWDGTSALHVLLLGTDQRPRETALQRWGNSDTMVLVSIDPVRQRASLVSVPRDLLVNIPGVGQAKVNAAYLRGGPALASRVIGDLLGVPIHRWASVDVTAFATLIDALGGVVVDVEQPLHDDMYPTEDYAVRRIFIGAGLQWLDGERALWYARSRHESSDFDRADRQQRLLMALKGRALDPGVVSRLPSLFKVIADAVQTDISPREALTLLSLGATADRMSVRSVVLTPPEYGQEVIRPDLYAILPDRARVRRRVASLLTEDPSPAGTATPGLTGTPGVERP